MSNNWRPEMPPTTTNDKLVGLALWLALITLIMGIWLLPPILAPEYNGPAEAQQPVNVSRINNAVPIYDPCLDPSKITVLNVAVAAGTAIAQLVPVSGVTRIYLCSAKVQGGAAGTITMRFGTGTNPNECATFPTDIDTTSITAAGDGALVTSGGAGTLARSGTGQALCWTRSANMTMHGHIRYVQE